MEGSKEGRTGVSKLALRNTWGNEAQPEAWEY